MRRTIHAKCLAVSQKNGRTLVCGKSKGHDAPDVADEKRREHFDPEFDERWPAKPVAVSATHVSRFLAYRGMKRSTTKTPAPPVTSTGFTVVSTGFTVVRSRTGAYANFVIGNDLRSAPRETVLAALHEGLRTMRALLEERYAVEDHPDGGYTVTFKPSPSPDGRPDSI
ncbi:hypothetical protein ACFZAM_31785 [Streptomyces sp. NPDC008079]|uniref:hypothetical protein n=1 Tax=Streptomyces sp. NPDC008079 TaxID=3364806 RepID=UPI0036E44841